MLRMTFILCSSLFLVMLLGGRDFGQLRPGLARAEAVAQAVPATASVPAVETASLAAVAVAAPVLTAAIAPVVVAPQVNRNPVAVAVPPAVPAYKVLRASSIPVPQEPENTVFTLSNYADPAPQAVTQPVPEQSAEGEIWYVAGNSLNVRAGPSTDDAVVGKLSRGEAMLVVARDGGDWAQIRIEGDGIEGYVATRFLTAEVPAIN